MTVVSVTPNFSATLKMNLDPWQYSSRQYFQICQTNAFNYARKKLNYPFLDSDVTKEDENFWNMKLYSFSLNISSKLMNP